MKIGFKSVELVNFFILLKATSGFSSMPKSPKNTHLGLTLTRLDYFSTHCGILSSFLSG